jgi:hypothetical protein
MRQQLTSSYLSFGPCELVVTIQKHDPAIVKATASSIFVAQVFPGSSSSPICWSSSLLGCIRRPPLRRTQLCESEGMAQAAQWVAKVSPRILDDGIGSTIPNICPNGALKFTCAILSFSSLVEQSQRTSLFEIHFVHQLFKPGFLAKIIECGINFQVVQPVASILISLFQQV